MKYQFKSLNSILGAFEVEVVYRKNAVEEYQQQIMQSTHGSSPSLKSGLMENKADDATKHTTVPGPVRLTRVSSNPRDSTKQSKYFGLNGWADPAMNYQQAFVGNNEINQSPVYQAHTQKELPDNEGSVRLVKSTFD